MKTVFVATMVLAIAGLAFYFSAPVHAAKGAGKKPATNPALTSPALTSSASTSKKLSAKQLSLPLFFEPNQGQTAPQVKFLAHGAGYGLFLTADEAVLKLGGETVGNRPSTAKRKPSSVIRMHLEGANPSARISGSSPLPGKTDYFIGNDPSKWHRNVPQFGRVRYRSVYPGVDLVYYGNQGQLEYDFRIAPGADFSQIALSFKGASARIDTKGASGDPGDLVLSTNSGKVRFHAPHVYQPSASGVGRRSENEIVAGAFRQLAGNKIGFSIGPYDHRRELVIDPTLAYSTYIGGTGTESHVKVAVDSAGIIYLAGSTNSTDYPVVVPSGTSTLTGIENIFFSKISPASPGGSASLLYSAYVGGTGTDVLAGIAVDQSGNIYLAGTTNSRDFPTTSNAFQPAVTTFPTTDHGFVTKMSLGLNSLYAPSYSTYLAGADGTDTITGLAVDTNQNAYVTGDTTSSNPSSDTDSFPANPNGYQTKSNYLVPAGHTQLFASKINTNGSGLLSMLYSTYFGGGYPAGAIAVGGGIAVSTAGSAVNMYITGTTNMPGGPGPNAGEVGFPLQNAQQNCLNNCVTSTNADAFVAKINPNLTGPSSLVYSTYLGGSGDETGTGVAVDSSGNAYVTGSTDSSDWVCSTCVVTGFQPNWGGGTDAFIAKIGNLSGSVYPLNYFTYIGGSGDDIGEAIVVDSVQAAHVAGSTTSTNLVPTANAVQPTLAGGQDAFAASISTTLANRGAGDLLTYLGGNATDQGTGVAIDVFGNTIVAGTTDSTNFPTKNPYQPTLNGSAPDAFVSQIVSVTNLTVAAPTTSPSPNPVAAGTQVAFTFNITNNSTDVANFVVFEALGLPTSGLTSTPTAKVTSGSGSCGTVQVSTITCNIPTLAVGAVATVEVDMTPAANATPPITTLTISGAASANGGSLGQAAQTTAHVVDFSIAASPVSQTINAGDTATFQVSFAPTSNLGYNATITPSETTSPSIVTATTPTFNPTTVTVSGSPATTTLSIPTVARPVTTGSLFRHGTFYATWLPVGGLSLATLGIGLGRRRRRLVIAVVLTMIAGAVVLQSACGKSSSTNTTSGGTHAGTYIVTITGSAGSSASHTYQVTLTVN